MGRFFITIAIILVLITNAYSQTNKGINYQAVARNASGNLLENQNISVRFSILEDSPTGNMVYSESQLAMTNEYGLFTLSIGNGNILSGDFSNIDWSGSNIYLKVEIDENGGNNYEVVGTTKFMSVPYALYGKDEDDDPKNEIQELNLSGTILSLSKNGGQVTLPSSGGGDNWGTQYAIVENTLKGKGTSAEPLGISQMGATEGQILEWDGTSWAPQNNESQTLTKEGGQIILSNGGGSVTDSVDDADSDPENELQLLSYSNDTLRLSLGGGEAVISAGASKLDDLNDAKTDDNNIFLGDNSGKNDNGNNGNTAVGMNSMHSNTSGQLNTANGYMSLSQNTTGNLNVGVGGGTLYSNTSGDNNVAVGIRALSKNTTGYSNIAIGIDALSYNTTRGNLVAVGDSALYNNGNGASGDLDANWNTAVGSKALYSNTRGYSNTANGFRALYSNTTGYYNTANGHRALYYNTTGHNNTANGNSALYSNTTGNDNTANGYSALYYNTTGNDNTANGYRALYHNTTGYYNTANGYSALFRNTTGHTNTAIGSQALHSNTTGKNNTAIGYGTIYKNTTGENNTAIGRGAYYYGNYSNSSAFGYMSSIKNSNQARIGNSSVTSIGGYAAWTNLSDGRYKYNLADDVKGLDFILKLHPVTYQMDVQGIAEFLGEDKRFDEKSKSLVSAQPDEFMVKSREEKSQICYSGFVAQEVEQVAKEVGYDFSGVDTPQNEKSLYGLRYAEFVVPLVKAMQEQQAIIEDQRKINESQQNIIEEQNIKIRDLINRLEKLEDSNN
jgi:hypothetical protein